MTHARLTLAIDRYDRHVPFFDGTLAVPDGIELVVRQVGEAGTLRDGRDRHARMLLGREFDVAELSFSSYLMAHARGDDLTAIPVFPRRLFSQTQMFVRAGSAIDHPSMLAGRRIGLQSFQTTLAVLAKGDSAHAYGLDSGSVTWVTRERETIPFEPPAGWKLETVPASTDLGAMLEAGAIDALFFSRVPAGIAAGRLRRLFRDPRAECVGYYRRYGFFPIMHVVALRASAVARVPEAPRMVFELFSSAQRLARAYRDDPGWPLNPFESLDRERDRAALGDDPWPIGLAANRANIERFIGYSREQGLIDRAPGAADLFHPALRET